MGRLFDNPVHLLILLLVILVVFGANKLPGAARSLGRSMRIFNSELHAMGDDDKDPDGRKARARREIEADDTVTDSTGATRAAERDVTPDDPR